MNKDKIRRHLEDAWNEFMAGGGPNSFPIRKRREFSKCLEKIQDHSLLKETSIRLGGLYKHVEEK